MDRLTKKATNENGIVKIETMITFRIHWPGLVRLGVICYYEDRRSENVLERGTVRWFSP